MTRQPSIEPQHRVLRGEAAAAIDRQAASLEGEPFSLERRRD